eukprot:535338_1
MTIATTISTISSTDELIIPESIDTMKSQKQLMLMHIPKTGGTAMEISAYYANVTKWGYYLEYGTQNRKELEITAEKICKTMNICNHYVSFWHIPLRWWIKYFDTHANNSVIKHYFDLDKVDYFCVVRNPVTKMISEFRYLTQYYYNIDIKCDAYSMNKWIHKELSEYKKRIAVNTKEYCYIGWHFVAQYDFVYDVNGNQICKNVLHFENLKEEFKSLMKQYNLWPNINIDTVHNPSLKCNTLFTIDNITNSNKQLIYELYRNDFETFNYGIHNRDFPPIYNSQT